jgi:hypothetical protein
MQILRIAASANAITGRTFTRVKGAWLVGGSDAASALIYDAATATGTDKFSLKAATALNSDFLDFGDGVAFHTDLSVTLTGTAAVLYLLVE